MKFENGSPRRKPEYLFPTTMTVSATCVSLSQENDLLLFTASSTYGKPFPSGCVITMVAGYISLGPGIPDRSRQYPAVSKQAARPSSISGVTSKPILGGLHH